MWDADSNETKVYLICAKIRYIGAARHFKEVKSFNPLPAVKPGGTSHHPHRAAFQAWSQSAPSVEAGRKNPNTDTIFRDTIFLTCKSARISFKSPQLRYDERYS
jgi:hypothetical protein